MFESEFVIGPRARVARGAHGEDPAAQLHTGNGRDRVGRFGLSGQPPGKFPDGLDEPSKPRQGMGFRLNPGPFPPHANPANIFHLFPPIAKAMSNLLIRNLRFPKGESGHLRIEDGLIVECGAGVEIPAEGDVLDGRGLLVLPGAIDMHVHFRTPGGEHKETLLTGARAAVKGGTTTCGDMPNTSPRTTTLAALEDKIAKAEGAPANMLFNFGAEPDNLEQVREAAGHPAVKALKIYMGPSTGQGGLAPRDVEAHFRNAAELDLPIMVHAEDLEQIEANSGRFPHDVFHHHRLRSAEGERAAVVQAIAWAERYGVRLYLAHCTMADAVTLAAQSASRDRIFVEVCPHHLTIPVESVAAPMENRFKVNPPLRTEAEREALFSCLAEGIDGLGSDHAPHTLEEKDAPYDDAPSGIPGVEYLFPLALDWLQGGAYGLERMIDLTSANVARFFGLNKGELAPGRDADLVLVDEKARWRIGEEDDQVASKCGWTVYQGRPVTGRVRVTLVGGKVVFGKLAP